MAGLIVGLWLGLLLVMVFLAALLLMGLKVSWPLAPCVYSHC